MYYEEKIVNGVLHWRGSPNGEWTAMSAERLTALVLELRNQKQPIQWPPVQPYQVVPWQSPWPPAITCGRVNE